MLLSIYKHKLNIGKGKKFCYKWNVTESTPDLKEQFALFYNYCRVLGDWGIYIFSGVKFVH